MTRTTSTLVMIDPGLTTGWAVFRHGKLVACGYVSSKKALKDSPWKVYLPEATCVVEMPQYYGSDKESNPQSILRNAALGGRYQGQADCVAAEVCELSPPNKWKGRIGKPPPGKQYIIEYRVLKRLSAAEKTLLYRTKSARTRGPWLNHNVVDAVGMGLWWLERLRIRTWSVCE